VAPRPVHSAAVGALGECIVGYGDVVRDSLPRLFGRKWRETPIARQTSAERHSCVGPPTEGPQDLDGLTIGSGLGYEDARNGARASCQGSVARDEHAAFCLALAKDAAVRGAPCIRGVVAEEPKVPRHLAEHGVNQKGRRRGRLECAARTFALLQKCAPEKCTLGPRGR
jgi:hypothetical protein